MFVRVESVAKPGHSSLAVKLPDMNFIFFEDCATGCFDDGGQVDQRNHQGAAFEEGLSKPPRV